MKLTIFGDEFIGPRLVVSVDLDGGFRQSEPSVESDSLHNLPLQVPTFMGQQPFNGVPVFNRGIHEGGE